MGRLDTMRSVPSKTRNNKESSKLWLFGSPSNSESATTQSLKLHGWAGIWSSLSRIQFHRAVASSAYFTCTRTEVSTLNTQTSNQLGLKNASVNGLPSITLTCIASNLCDKKLLASKLKSPR